MSAKLHVLPRWKKDSTASEWLQEVAAMALAAPEKFHRIAIVYESEDERFIRTQSRNCRTNTDICALFEMGKLDV